MTQDRLGAHLDCDVEVVNRIVNGRSSVTAEVALELGAAFGTSAEFWMNARLAVDLYRATHAAGRRPKRLQHPG